jgi:2-polyprenyl-3-methyl-5-hydroxy-6-metoxy-1,4-benzoquinol methylase
MPSPEEVESFYQNFAYFEGDSEVGYRSYADMHKALAPHFRRRLRRLAQAFPKRGHLVDVGCADGFSLQLARADGWEVFGIEISRSIAEEASQKLGIPIVSSYQELPERPFDVLTLWEVIEHLPELLATLSQLRERLRPGGALMLSTPNAGHWQAVRAPELWTAYRPPAHLVLFTVDSLRLALEKAGLTGIHIWKTAPLPPLPEPLRRATMPLEWRLADGSARPWMLARALWLAVRLLGWAWQRLTRPQEDVFATLEAIAWRPK